MQGRIANAKNLGRAIYAVGFAIWLFGYLSPQIQCQISHAKNHHHASVTAPKTTRAVKANRRVQVTSHCPPINWNHAREAERKSDFCFEVGNEARNPPRRGPLPIKYWGVAFA